MRETCGHAAPGTVVCVHGAGGGGWEWGVWARVFAARGYAVIAPDLQPAAGGLAATRYADYLDQVVQWCRGVGAPSILVGASLGGALALAAADVVGAQALILVNPLVPRSPRPRPRPAIIGWGSQRSLGSTRRAMSDADDAASLHAFRRWRDESGAVLDEAEAAAAKAASCAALVLASDRDENVPLPLSRALAIRIDADFERIAGAGHLGPLLGRVAASVAERAADWLQRRRDDAGDEPAGVV